jgi:hypothetical protein
MEVHHHALTFFENKLKNQAINTMQVLTQEYDLK